LRPAWTSAVANAGPPLIDKRSGVPTANPWEKQGGYVFAGNPGVPPAPSTPLQVGLLRRDV